jgi:Cytochrome oxidase complex assembly protein 1
MISTVYPPVSQSTPTPSPRKTRILPWILGGCGVLIVGFLAFIAFIIFVVGAATRSSDPYKAALARAQADPRVAEALGTPLEPGWFTQGSISVNNDSGQCDMTIPVSGPKGKAKIYVVGAKERGRWSYSSMVVTPESGPEIDLLTAESSSTAPPAG